MNINYKELLPNNKKKLSIQINTKVLPTKGNLAYEYNPLRNYRISENKYQYNNKFYSEKELIQENIFSDIVEYINIRSILHQNKNYNICDKSIVKFDKINSNFELVFKGVRFQIPVKIGTEITNNVLQVIIPLVDDEETYIFSEKNLLTNSKDIKLHVFMPNSLDKYLYSDKYHYVAYYDLDSNEFGYVSDIAQLPKGIQYESDPELKFKKEFLCNVSFSSISTKFYHIINSQIVDCTNQITSYEKNSLVDFQTDELKFSLEYPVQILPQYSYDGSVNLVMTDGYSKPKLINTRFSTTGKNTYQIVDRKGNNDTNIYNEGTQFELDTSLYKLSSNIPKLVLNEVYSGGMLSVGNYHFYLTYSDADRNETDFVCESGMVSVFVGNTIKSIRQGFRNENSFKGIRFTLKNIDPAYSYVNVYYTRSTGDIHQNSAVQAYRLTQPIFITNTENQVINITGYEDVTELTLEDINPSYQIIESAETLATNKNILFLGNVQKETPNYQELEDLALHFGPILDTSLEYSQLDQNYNNEFGGVNESYYDPKFIYNNVGYWPEEIYRFGVVFVLYDNTLTSVFNVRGINNLSENTEYTKLQLFNNGNREYIEVNENSKLLVKGNIKDLENAKGVVRLHSTNDQNKDTNLVYGIKFRILSDNQQEFIDELKKHCKGYFFVRQKRIPTVLGEGMTIGIEKNGHHPCLPVSSNIISTLENCKKVKKNTSVKLADNDTFTKITSTKEVRCCPYINFRGAYGYVAEAFLSMNRELVHDFEYHLRTIANASVNVEGMIYPDYDINSEYLNSIFTGDEFTLVQSGWQPTQKYFDANKADRHFYIQSSNYQRNLINSSDSSTIKTKIVGVEDGTPMAGLEDSLYSGLAGEPSMGYKFDKLSGEQISTETTNLVRGIWGPFLALKPDKKMQPCTIYTVMVPGYKQSDMENYFVIRYNDKTSYYAISDRYEISDLYNLEDTIFYRGDCYICQFTHRMNRNFNDDTSPYNDTIVNRKTWKGENNGEPLDDEPEDDYKGFMVKDNVIRTQNFKHVNLGDINAVKLGHWVTFQLRSSFNLNIRAIDDSDISEVARIGHGKGFYPYNTFNAGGAYKHQEALCVNKGYEKSVSERYNFEQPDVPAIKNNFCNRIIYSNPQITDSFKNGFRQFKGGNYQDYQMNYGSITKILSYGDGLLIVFEHGVGYLGVNERSLLANASDGNVYLNSSRVLPDDGNMTVISDCFGSQWKDSIIKTQYAVYGVDTQAKKIWSYGAKGFRCISDFRVQKYLNENITLGERELTPILGIRNVKTHHNNFKNDVMFTFYDNLENAQERVWNLCYNENMDQFITFYSWVPSYSENIYNQYFSFDRETSKWIAKLGQSSYGNDFSQGIVLKNDNSLEATILPDSLIRNKGAGATFGVLDLSNISYKKINKFELMHDNLQSYKLFQIYKQDDQYKLALSTDTYAAELLSERYYRTRTYDENGEEYTGIYYVGNEKNKFTVSDNDSIKIMELDKDIRLNSITTSTYLPIYLNSDGTRKELPYPLNMDKVVYTLKIKCEYESITGSVKEFTDNIAVTLQYNLQFLTTDFWKHGQSGLIDIAEKIKPAHWYGKQHPFEFEFIVAAKPEYQKIFDNLLILSNSAEPESFHYEIVGDSYDFSKDKPNMYYRQEATEALYQYNGSDIEYDMDFEKTKDSLNHRHLYQATKDSDEDHDYKEYYKDLDGSEYVKSTVLPLYYSRTNSSNEIEDYYKQQTAKDKNYDALSGAEITYDKTTDEYNIWQHSKGVSIREAGGRSRGNMDYLEDRWLVQINPLNTIEKNESEWKNGVPPIVLFNKPDPQSKNLDSSEFSEELAKAGYTDINCVDTSESWGDIKQTKLRDKYMRVRIRYSGKKLAIIQSVMTIFRISYA